MTARVTLAPGHAGVARIQALARPRGALASRLGDSKRLIRHGDTTLGEAWARAITIRMETPAEARGTATRADSPDTLVQALSLDESQTLRAPCPRDHAAQCWSPIGETFSAQPELVDQVTGDLAALDRKGLRVLRAACVITCARRLNDGVARGLTRFDIDLHAMERLALDARARDRHDVVAICGKVGSFDRYPAAFGPLSGRPCTVIEEGRARSEYAIAGLGRLAFVRDADDSHVLVSMASLVGKWVRDTLMARVVRYHRAIDPTLPEASGYQDPVTARFIEGSRLARGARALPDDCFERRALKGTR
ncbi:MAG: hypothetical protein ACREJ3_01760 [Polyangiaceae bacterium]